MRKRLALGTGVLALLVGTVLWFGRGEAPVARAVATRAAAASAGGHAAPQLAAPARRRWEPGLDRTYALDFTTTVTSAGSAVAFRVRGAWQTTVVDGGDAAMLRIQLANAEVTLGGQAAPSIGAEVARPWFAELDADGRLVAAWFDAGVSRASRDALKSIAADLQYCGGDCHRSEQDATGAYDADYAAEGGAVTRAKLRYTAVVSARGSVAPKDVGGPDVVRSAARFELDADGWPTRVRVDEQLAAALRTSDDAHAQQLGAAVALDLAQTGEAWRRDLADSFAVARPQLHRYAPLAELPDEQRDAEALDRNALGGADYASLSRELSAARDDHAQAAVQRRLRALFRLDPDAATRSAALLRDPSLDAANKQVVIAALASSGAAEAQRTLVAYLPDAPADLREAALGSLGITPTPTPETIAAMRALAAPGGADESTALLAVGSLARYDDGDSVAWLLDRLRDAASPADVAECLRALGNAGDVRALPAIQAALASPDATVRAAAVAALRMIPDAAADALIAQVLLGDADSHVRTEAVFAAAFRPFDVTLPRLSAALQRDPAMTVRMHIVALLRARRGQSAAACDPLLGWAAQHDADAQVRKAASEALAS